MSADFSKQDILRFFAGESTNAYEFMGCHAEPGGHRFMVWAPNAKAGSVVGDFNGWEPGAAPMQLENGIWTAHVSGLKNGDLYKYAVLTANNEVKFRADPFAVRSELRPGTASVIWSVDTYEWSDAAYMRKRKTHDPYHTPMNIYEVNLGSWKHGLSYSELARELPKYAKDMGYTHIEFMPVAEYPLDMSWGYQVTGFYSLTSRYGTPQAFMELIDNCHALGLGVIMDWVPAHFPKDEHGLYRFDGTPLYEHSDPLRSEQPQWGTAQFNFERYEVVSFLISNAVFWMEKYHIDGFRVDAVSCMLYHDYGRRRGHWLPNKNGGRENLEAIAFLQLLSKTLFGRFKTTLLIAEESSAFPLVTKPTYDGGLGFNFKWNMGWMNDTLEYMEMDSYFRKWHHNKLTFSMYYAFSENYILPFSHDEVVHGKKSLLDKAGRLWQKFAQLRLLYCYTIAHPGKKLLFMGSEFGQFIEWKYNQSLDWFLLDFEAHDQLHKFTRTLNHFYLKHKQLWEIDDGWDGFEWLNVSDDIHSMIAFVRRAKHAKQMVCIFNFTPVPWSGDYRLGVPGPGTYTQIFNSDDACYGGTGQWDNKPLKAQHEFWNSRNWSIDLKIPPYAALMFTYEPAAGTEEE
jgi:1,4-alpha-glucan branching enzyme